MAEDACNMEAFSETQCSIFACLDHKPGLTKFIIYMYLYFTLVLFMQFLGIMFCYNLHLDCCFMTEVINYLFFKPAYTYFYSENSQYLKVKVYPKLLLSQSKFSDPRKFTLRYSQPSF